MRLTLIISSLSSGGAERVMSVMANYWAKKGWQVTLLTFDDGHTAPFYPLDSRVSHLSLALAGDSSNSLTATGRNLARVRRLRSAIRRSRPDCVLSFMDQVNVLTLLATEGLRTPVIVVEQSWPPSQQLGRAWNQLRNWTYPRAFRVVGVTKSVLSHFSTRIQSRSCVIPNPVLSPTLVPDSSSQKLLDHPALLAIGRLDRNKGHDLLLKAFAGLNGRHSNWSLTILGEGPLREELESMCRRLKIEERVKLPGRVSDTSRFLREASIFVMASRSEGFPMALGEAMACGLPVIATNCPSGPAEMISDGVNGILVPSENVDALSSALDRLMTDAELRRALSLRAREVTERFGLDSIMQTWEALIEQAARA
ncbi:MAG: glycosyltransferase family 4 protein [Pyrinomonadaceae bacterium]|nr:glycosyltransferase family 4 protein [Pyrinomonadaceae bacterium]